MSSFGRSLFFAGALLSGATLFALAACGPPPAPPPPTGGGVVDDPGTTTSTDTTTSAETTTSSSSASTSDTPTEMPACKLSSPVKSQDRCQSDADCGVSEPCHAHACVAKAKAHPPDKSTMCTRMMDCQSADANTCGCLDGVCALYPPR